MEVPEWQPDEATKECFLCRSTFTFFTRRHHCRKCGRVVCASCSDQNIKYFPNTLVVHAYSVPLKCNEHQTYRTCDECVAEVKMIRQTLMNSPVELRQTASNATSNRSSANRSNRSSSISTSANSKHARVVVSCPMLSASSLVGSRDTESDHNICPVCAVDLLQLYVRSVQMNGSDSSLNAFECFKETHVSDCLVNFDFNNDHMRLQTPPSASHARNRMLVYNIPPIPKPRFEILGGPSNSVDTILQNKELCGLLPSSASVVHEKEVLDDECVICLEDLKPGDKVGRLECLCVFHYKCIKDWFNKKSYGECPVHFLHR